MTASVEDMLSTFVAQLGLQGSVFGRVALVAPWGLAQSKCQEMTFHIMLRGECFLGIGDGRRTFRKFTPGDFILFPHGSPHALASNRNVKLIPAERVCYTFTNTHGDRFQSGPGTKAEMICGSFRLVGPNAQLLLRALPEVVAFRAKGPSRNRWIRSTLEFIAHEVSTRPLGSDRLIQQLLDTLFVQILRFCATSLGSKDRGFFAALRDPSMMKVLTKICDEYSTTWSLAAMAKESGLSRTALAVKFQTYFGQGAATFLRNHRLSCAMRLLADTHLSIKEIAGRTGFGSTEVFIRNFERTIGLTPHRYRAQLVLQRKRG